jgi:hypothetical protein
MLFTEATSDIANQSNTGVLDRDIGPPQLAHVHIDNRSASNDQIARLPAQGHIN